MPRKQHTHKYARVKTDNNYVWACALPGCNHFMPYHLRSLMTVNRRSICWQCEDEFVIDEGALKEDGPRCGNCRFGVIQDDLINAMQSGRNKSRE